MANVSWDGMGMLQLPEIPWRGEVLNRKQCENLLLNFQNGVKILANITNGPAKAANVFHAAQRDLFRIVSKGRVLIEECCKENWVHASVMQLNNKEWFRELLVDFEHCFHTFCDISCHWNLREKERILVIKANTTFYPTSIDAVKEDQTSICRRLSKHLDLCNTKDCKDCRLVQYLEEYMTCVQRVEGGDLDKIVFPYNYPRPEYGDPPNLLGNGDGGKVYRTKWMGFECATKLIDKCGDDGANKIWKEASILGGLNHPNLIKFLCCGHDPVEKRFELVMELGSETLSQYLNLEGTRNVLTEENAVDVMLQIASGMCYLHDMKVAHRDLKPDNVVVIRSNDSQLVNLEFIHVKLLDFGISKVEVKDSLEVPTGKFKMGTCGYMAPEAMAKNLTEVDALKADVFSFAMMCSDILSGDKPCFGKLDDYREYLRKSNRPKLLETYSQVLRSLVDECWSSYPSKRPKFLDICKRLAQLKNTILKNSLEIIEVTNDAIGMVNGSLEITRVTNDTDGHRWKLFLPYFSSFQQSFSQFMEWLWVVPHFVEEKCSESLSHPILIGVQEKMSQLEKQLLEVGCLGIVGIGGIGKSTLAKALSDHIFHHFDVICFVEFDLNDEKCIFTSKHKSLDVRDSPPQAQTLSTTRDFLISVHETKKLLLVVDNVSNTNQLCKLLVDSMFKDVDGMKLITSSRNWDSLKQHVPTAGKVDMQILEGNQPMRLFSRHAFGTNELCLPYLEYVAKEIVDACFGLPLNLEVMGTCMQGETRLRIWERTLHRLLRARYDRSSDKQLLEPLRENFKSLSIQGKNMFLDIACFFCKDMFTPKEIFLKMLDENPREILENLHNKSLVKVDEWDCLDMHEQLRGMGRMITETDEEFVGTRLLDLSYCTFASYYKQKGIERVRGLSFTKLERKGKYEIDVEFKTMENLHILIVQFCNNFDLVLAIVKQSPNLKFLRMRSSTSNIPSSMGKSDFIEKFWNHSKHHLQNLRILEVFNCNFSGLLSCEYSKVMPLKAITFLACQNIEGLLNEVVKCSTLESLNISGCTNLQKIPEGLTNLCALEELNFSKCWSLRKIPKGLGGLISLRTLYMSECEALEELDFSKCRSLMNTPQGFGGLTSLKSLDMSECQSLEVFPIGLTNLCALEVLNFSKCQSLRKIPEGFGGLTSLKKLYMLECEVLEEFPLGTTNLCRLEDVNFSKCRSLRRIPEGFGGLTRLKKLYMWECEALVEFPVGLTNLCALEELDFSKCRALRKITEGFGSLTSLKKLHMWECDALEEFPPGLNNLCALEEWNFSKCGSLRMIPEGFGGLTSLKKLDMWNCEALMEFPVGLTNLYALEELNFSECRSLRKIPEGFGGLKNLKKLYMLGCEALEEFPRGLTNLYGLEELIFSKCGSLTKTPKGFDGLRNLKKL